VSKADTRQAPLSRKLLLLGALPAVIMFVVLMVFFTSARWMMPARIFPRAASCWQTLLHPLWNTRWLPETGPLLSRFCLSRYGVARRHGSAFRM
jgi:hypothetical protein